MKRRRPCRHYRRIKTKKGRKRILINPKIKRRRKKPQRAKIKKGVKRIPINTSIWKSPNLAKMSVDEILRLAGQQEEMNLVGDIKLAKSLEKELAPLLKKQQEKEDKQAVLFKAQSAAIEDQKLQAFNKTQAQRNAFKKLKELENLGRQLERKRKASTKVGFWEKPFKSGKTVEDKLHEAKVLAKTSGDRYLISKAKEMENFFLDEIRKPQKEVLIASLKQKEKEGNLTQREKAALKAVTLPEIKGTEGVFISGKLIAKTVDEAIKPTHMKEWDTLIRARIKEAEKLQARIKEDKRFSITERRDTLKKISNFQKNLRREVEKERRLSPKQRDELYVKIKKLKKDFTDTIKDLEE